MIGLLTRYARTQFLAPPDNNLTTNRQSFSKNKSFDSDGSEDSQLNKTVFNDFFGLYFIFPH